MACEGGLSSKDELEDEEKEAILTAVNGSLLGSESEGNSDTTVSPFL